MKKIILFVLIIAIIMGAGIYFLQKRAGITIFQAKKFEIINVLPEKPVVYLEFQNTKENIEKLVATPFWKALGEVDWELLLSSDPKNMQGAMVYRAIREALEDPKQIEVLSKFVGKNVSFAVYPFEINLEALKQGDPRILQDILSRVGQSLYFITRLDAEAQIAELISRSVDQFGENVSMEELMYKDQSIQLIKFKDSSVEIAYTRIKDLLVVALDKFAIQRSIDVYQDASASMEMDSNYTQTRSLFINEADSMAYINSQYFIKAIADGLLQLSAQEGVDSAVMQKQIDQTFKSVQGFRSVGVSGRWTELLQTKLDFHFDLLEMQDTVSKYYQNCTNVMNQSLELIPKEVIVYQWANCFDLDYYWEEMKEELERTVVPGQPSPGEQIAQYEKMIGMSIEGDILPAFGKEIGGYLKTIHVNQKFPIPELLLFLKINDRVKADKLIGLLKNQPMVVFQTENHKGITVNYLSLPIAEHVSPGYAFVNDYLLIAVNKELLMTSIDVSKKESAGLRQNASFEAVNQGITTENVGIQYLEIDELAFKITSLLEWSNEWASTNDRKQEAFKTGAELRLTQVQKSIEEDEEVLSTTQAEIADLESRVATMVAGGQDAGILQKSLRGLKDKEAGIRGDIEASIDEALEIQQTIKGYSKRAMPAEERDKYLKRVIFPVVDSFKTIDGLGTVTTMSESAMETRMFMKL